MWTTNCKKDISKDFAGSDAIPQNPRSFSGTHTGRLQKVPRYFMLFLDFQVPQTPEHT